MQSIKNFDIQKNRLNNSINISVISTSSKAGKSMLIDLLRQTDFIERSILLPNNEFTLIHDKSVILRKIPSSKIKNKDTIAHQWIKTSDIVILVVRESLTVDDYEIVSIRHSSDKKTLFIVQTHINETIINAQRTLQEIKNVILSRLGEFLVCENDIYFIGSCFNDTKKWDFSRLKDDLIKRFSSIKQEQNEKSLAESGVLNHNEFLQNTVLLAHPLLFSNFLSNLFPENQNDEAMLNEEKDLLIKYFRQHGLDKVDQYLISRLRKWEQCALNLAVTGQSGAGKSSFINAIRGVTPNSEDAAKTGYVECTIDAQAYPHPLHKNLIFWDLPGCGTPKFPRETYLNDINFEKYDVVLIISSGRFTENDAWLAEEMIRMRKTFFFLRSKIDSDMENAARDCRVAINEDEVLRKIRSDCLNQLKHRTHNEKVYLISGRLQYLHKWDMSDFIYDLCESCPHLKRESLVFSMSINCREAVRGKVEYLRKRKWFLASATAAGAILPIPGLSMSVNVLACITEAKEYRHQLGLHNEAVERLAHLRNTSSESIRTTINSVLPILDEDIFEQMFKEKLITVSAALGHCVPIMGSVFSIRAVQETLDYFLTLMEKAALMVIDIYFSEKTPVNSTTTTTTAEINVT